MTAGTADPARKVGSARRHPQWTNALRMTARSDCLPREALGDTTDEALVILVADGNRAAYAELVSRHLDRTVTIAGRILGSRADAEEVAQEAFLRLWRDAGRFRPELARFSTWFYRITANLCLDSKRRPVQVPLESAGDPRDPAPDPETRLETDRTRAAVTAAVAGLPERLRTAVSLTYDAGLSNAEAAAAMEIGVKALESLLVRARRSLRERLVAWTAGGPMEGGNG